MGFELLGLGFAVPKTIENGNGIYIFIWYTGISNNWDWDFEKDFAGNSLQSPHLTFFSTRKRISYQGFNILYHNLIFLYIPVYNYKSYLHKIVNGLQVVQIVIVYIHTETEVKTSISPVHNLEITKLRE